MALSDGVEPSRELTMRVCSLGASSMIKMLHQKMRAVGIAVTAIAAWIAFSSASFACQKIEVKDWTIRFIVSRCRNTSECRSAYWGQCFKFEGVWNGFDQSCGENCQMELLATNRGPIDGFVTCSAMSAALESSSPPRKGQKAVLEGTFVSANKNSFGIYIELKDCTLIQP